MRRVEKSENIQQVTGIPHNLDKLFVCTDNSLVSLWQSELTLGEFKIMDASFSRVDPNSNASHQTVLFQHGEIEKLLGVKECNGKDLDERMVSLLKTVFEVHDADAKNENWVWFHSDEKITRIRFALSDQAGKKETVVPKKPEKSENPAKTEYNQNEPDTHEEHPATDVIIPMDSVLKAQAEAFFGELGMDLSTACSIFVRQSLREGRIPFEISANHSGEET